MELGETEYERVILLPLSRTREEEERVIDLRVSGRDDVSTTSTMHDADTPLLFSAVAVIVV